MISGIVFLAACFYLFRQYSEIAFEFKKNRVGFGFAGVGFFIASYFIAAVISGILIGLINDAILRDTIVSVVFTLVIFGFAIALTTIIGKQFKKSWAKNAAAGDQLLDR